MRLVCTGGGTGGHILPAVAVIQELRRHGEPKKLLFIGEKGGLEERMVKEYDIPFRGISAGKFRRYLSLKNLFDPFKVVKGFAQARSILKKFNPDIVFSKGGYVSVPVAFAAFSLKIPVVIHESDYTPGLSIRLQMPFAKIICVSFEETHNSKKTIVTGQPIRTEILGGKESEGYRLTHFHPELPTVFFIGGSLGAHQLNKLLEGCLKELIERAQVIHSYGPKNEPAQIRHPRYFAKPFIEVEELRHFYAMSDLIVSRAGANVLFEILAMKKPSLLIPLSKTASRGDQILNAQSIATRGAAKVLDPDKLSQKKFKETLFELLEDKKRLHALADAAKHYPFKNGAGKISELLIASLERKTK